MVVDPLFVNGSIEKARTDDANCKTVAYLSEGALIGESRLLQDEDDVPQFKRPTRNASVIANGDLVVLTISCSEARLRISSKVMWLSEYVNKF